MLLRRHALFLGFFYTLPHAFGFELPELVISTLATALNKALGRTATSLDRIFARLSRITGHEFRYELLTKELAVTLEGFLHASCSAWNAPEHRHSIRYRLRCIDRRPAGEFRRAHDGTFAVFLDLAWRPHAHADDHRRPSDRKLVPKADREPDEDDRYGEENGLSHRHGRCRVGSVIRSDCLHRLPRRSARYRFHEFERYHQHERGRRPKKRIAPEVLPPIFPVLAESRK